jgi:hypothetical protein
MYVCVLRMRLHAHRDRAVAAVARYRKIIAKANFPSLGAFPRGNGLMHLVGGHITFIVELLQQHKSESAKIDNHHSAAGVGNPSSWYSGKRKFCGVTAA